MVDMVALRAIADERDLWIIEDACQAHGAECEGRRAGSLGDAAAFSFYYSKNLGAYGEGGCVTTNDGELARRVRMLRDHGAERRYYHELVGWNSRLDELQAAILRAKLPHLQRWNAQRRSHASLYETLLDGSPVITPVTAGGNCHVYHLYVVRVPRRDELRAWLQEHGVGTGIHYPVPIHLQRAYSDLGYQRGDLPVTERVADEILSLPMFPELQREQIAYVADAVRAFVGASAPVEIA